MRNFLISRDFGQIFFLEKVLYSKKHEIVYAFFLNPGHKYSPFFILFIGMKYFIKIFFTVTLNILLS